MFSPSAPKSKRRRIEYLSTPTSLKDEPIRIPARTLVPGKLLNLIEKERQTKAPIVQQSKLLRDSMQHVQDKLTRISEHLEFHRETEWISLLFLHRYIATTRVNRKQLELTAVACLFLASKLEEEIADIGLKELSDLSKFPVDEIKRAERRLLDRLGWEFSYVTPWNVYYHLVDEFEWSDTGLSSLWYMEINNVMRDSMFELGSVQAIKALQRAIDQIPEKERYLPALKSLMSMDCFQ